MPYTERAQTAPDEIPAVAKLNSDLLGAVRRAAADAAHDGVQFYVDSGCPAMYADPTHDPRMQQ